jgi:hypothetical protein
MIQFIEGFPVDGMKYASAPLLGKDTITRNPWLVSEGSKSLHALALGGGV